MSINLKEAAWENEHSPQERGTAALHVKRNTEAAGFQSFSGN